MVVSLPLLEVSTVCFFNVSSSFFLDGPSILPNLTPMSSFFPASISLSSCCVSTSGESFSVELHGLPEKACRVQGEEYLVEVELGKKGPCRVMKLGKEKAQQYEQERVRSSSKELLEVALCRQGVELAWLMAAVHAQWSLRIKRLLVAMEQT
ncbi:hypothetical protein CRG98_012294 [Punica granatum]|uniref:Uncharacterized protein n=1 Tax=Punica granatum TaxID=22663 RepID=A0A2I0KFR9_PUNGR|nr:hypothetical protein CRG98_012294 [Punica granatum]